MFSSDWFSQVKNIYFVEKLKLIWFIVILGKKLSPFVSCYSSIKRNSFSGKGRQWKNSLSLPFCDTGGCYWRGTFISYLYYIGKCCVKPLGQTVCALSPASCRHSSKSVFLYSDWSIRDNESLLLAKLPSLPSPQECGPTLARKAVIIIETKIAVV